MSLQSLGLGPLFYGEKEETKEQEVNEFVQDYSNKTLLKVETEQVSKKIRFTCIWLDQTKEAVKKSRAQIREDQIPTFFIDVYDDLATIVDEVIKKSKYKIKDRQYVCLQYPFATKKQTIQTKYWNIDLKEIMMPPQEQMKQLIKLTKKQNEVQASQHALEIVQLQKSYQEKKNQYGKQIAKLRKLCSDASKSLLKQKTNNQQAEKNAQVINKQYLSANIVSMIQSNLDQSLILQQMCLSNNIVLSEIKEGNNFSSPGFHKETNILNNYFKQNTVTEFIISTELTKGSSQKQSSSQIKNPFACQKKVENEGRIVISGFKENGEISYESKVSEITNTFRIQVDRFINKIRFTNNSPFPINKLSDFIASDNSRIKINIKFDVPTKFKVSVKRSDQFL